ncbi:MAG: amidohydrolase [Deltaproteobacteria bacterium]|nr:amidohydrolase [Deltaproteobacteria bacterium]
MDRIERKILDIIDANATNLITDGRALFSAAERGFAEFGTARMAAAKLRAMGLQVREELAVTGVKAVIGKGNGPTVAVIGELDGIMCAEHPHAVPETGMSHACGHNAQMMAMFGAAMALSDPEVAASLDGRVAVFAVPAEEYLAADVRESLQEEGKIRYFSGKSELIRLGEFDDIDISLTTHAHMVANAGCDILLGNNSVSGFIGKTAVFKGKAAHAAAAPHEGINALNAAALGLSALGMIRETFQEKDYIRVHPVMRSGGGAVNVVPQEAVLDMMVRAKTMAAIQEASGKVDRAFRGAASAVGAEVSIRDAQGYMPVIERAADPVLYEAAAILGDGVSVKGITEGIQNAASTDAGDLTHIMPVLNFTFGGCEGALHSRDFRVTDEELFYVTPAKLLALTTYRLLRGGAREVEAILEAFHPVFSREAYLRHIEAMHG